MSVETSAPKGHIEEHGPFIAVTGYEDSLDLWDALAAHYLARRPIRMTTTMAPRAYPETTVGDVHMVAGVFSERVKNAAPDTLGLPAAKEDWLAYQPEIQRATAGKLLHEVFPDNARFWRVTRKVAVYLSATFRLPTKAEIVLDLLKANNLVPPTAPVEVAEGVMSMADNIADAASDLLGRSGNAAESIVEGTVHAAQAIGRGTKSVVKGTVEGVGDALIKPVLGLIGKPLLIGAAVVGGLIIVPKLLDNNRRAA